MALSGQRPIAYNVNLARAAGDVKAGLFLSQLLYWTRVGVEVDARLGWIFKTREQWTLETGLSRAEQERCRSLLIAAGLIQESHFAGTPARLGFRIQPEALGMAISGMLRRDPVQWTLFDLRSSEQHVRALLGRNMAFYRVYVDALGSVPLAVFVTKALEIQRRLLEAQIDKERRRKTLTPPEEWQQNWFSLSVDQWEVETALRAGQVRKCKQDLCLEGILEEATQTWPRKRQFIRVNMDALSGKLMHRLAEQRNTSNQSANGLLQTLVRRGSGVSLGNISKNGTRPVVFSDPCRNNSHIARTDVDLFSNSSGAPFCRTDSLGINATNRRTGESAKLANMSSSEPSLKGQLAKVADGLPRNRLAIPINQMTGRSLQVSPPSLSQFQRSLARVSQSANQAGANQQGQRAVSAIPAATYCTARGHFEHDLRRVSAPLHTRADLGLQNLTTTTTTSRTSSRSLQVGSVSPNRRVVVVSPTSPRNTSDIAVAPSFDLAWPQNLNVGDIELAKRLLVPVPASRQQALVDELAGRLRSGAVRNPLGYLRQLIALDRESSWDMVLEVARDEADRRAIQARHRAKDSVPPSNASGQAATNVCGDAAATAPGVPPDVRQRLIALRASIVGKPIQP